MNAFEDLDVWKKSYRLVVELYKELQNCKDCGLKDQMTRRQFPSRQILRKARNAERKKSSSIFFQSPKAASRTPDANL